jgi:hypothetical protein
MGAEPVFGALAAPVLRAGGCVAASGAGAMLAAADAQGHVADYLGPADDLSAASVAACPLTLVDLGGYLATDTSTDTLYPPPVSRAAVFSAVDARIATLLPKLPIDSALVIAGLDDADPGAARLHALLATGQGASGPFTPGHWLRTAQNRTDGVVRSTDLTPSLLHWAGLTDGQIAAAEPQPLAGSSIGLGAPTPDGDGSGSDGSAAVLAASRLDTANFVYEDTNGAFVTWMMHAVLVLALAAGTAAALGLATGRPRGRRTRQLLLLAFAGWATVLGAAVPASFLAGLDDWSAAADPAQRLYGLTGALAVLLGVAVLAVCRLSRLRDRSLAPAGILALLTLAVLVGDVSSGSRLERQSPLGLSFLAAERFFGIGDAAIGVYCAAAVIGTFFAARLVLPDGAFALFVVCLIGLVAMIVCGLGAWGDRPAGVVALAPGLVLLALLAARRRLPWFALPALLMLTCLIGWAVDGAGVELPKTALLFAVPLGVATCALGLLRPAAATAADSAPTAAATAATATAALSRPQ